MKVLFVTFWYPSDENPGQGVFIKEHAAALSEVGIKVHIINVNIAYRPGLVFQREIFNHPFPGDRQSRVTEIRINSSLRKYLYYFSPFFFPYFRKLIIGQLRGVKPDIVHSNILYPAGMIGYRLSRYMGVPHVLTEHWSEYPRFFKGNIFKKQGRAVLNNSAAITAVSEFLAKRMLSFCKPRKINIVPNVIDETLFYHSAKGTREEAGSEVFLAVAHWQKGKVTFKRPELFMEALDRISRASSFPKIRLVLVGGGNMIPELKERAAKLSFPVDFTGAMNKEGVAELMRKCDYFLHASNIETFSIVVAEALKSGMPVVASDKGAIPELVNEHSGILVDNTIESWKRGIEIALNKRFDKHAIAEEYHTKYTRKSVGEAFLEIYSTLLR